MINNIFPLKDGEYIEILHDGEYYYTFIPFPVETDNDEYHAGNLTQFLRHDAPPSVRDLLNIYGDVLVNSITVCKKPIQKAIDSVLNLISFGAWESTKRKLNYDDLFHLFMIIELSNATFRLEKNQVVNLELLDGYFPDEQTLCYPVDLTDSAQRITLRSLFDNAVARYGKEQIYIYDPVRFNCQTFVTNILEASNLMKASGIRLYKFINQNTKELFDQMPSIVGKVAKGVVDVAALFDRILYGASSRIHDLDDERLPEQRVQAVMFDKFIWSVSQAIDWLEEHGYDPIKFDETKNKYRFRMIDPDDFDSFISKAHDDGVTLVMGVY